MIFAATIYLIVGLIVFFLVTLTDEYNPKKRLPTFILTAFLWPMIFIVWGIAALVK